MKYRTSTRKDYKDAVFDVETTFEFNGKLITRFFEKKFCKQCNKLMYPKLIETKWGWQVESDNGHFKRNYCGKVCGALGRSRKKKVKIRQFTIPIEGVEVAIEKFIFGRVLS